MIIGAGMPLRRIYLFHVLAFVAAAVLLALIAPDRPTRAGPVELSSVAAYVRARLEAHPSNLARARPELVELAARLRVAVTVYGPDGRPVLDIALAESPAAGSRVQDELRGDEIVVKPGGEAVFRIRNAPGHLARVQVGWAPPHPPRSPVPAALVLLLAILGASFAFDRSLARPIRRLSATAARFGAGDLGARAEVQGGELGEVALAFDHMAARIERLVRNQKEMLANISHELRTPLARVQIAIELAAEGDPELAQAALTDIEEDVTELRELLDDVLAQARLDLTQGHAGSGTPPHHFAPVDPRAVLEQAVDRLRAKAPERNIEVQLAGDLPAHIRADRVLLRRAIDNLLDNARKYTVGTIRLAATVAGGGLSIDVCDEGPGLTPEQCGRLFTPFYRADPTRAPGLGLGLSLVSRIAELHGGAVTVTSTPEAGSTFTMTISRT